jgi:hypothetical protein
VRLVRAAVQGGAMSTLQVLGLFAGIVVVWIIVLFLEPWR